MTVPCNTGFTEAAKFLTGEAADVFKYVAVGKGTGQGAANTKLASECTETGLTRAEADTCHTTKTTIDNDTVELVHTFTASGLATSVTVTEAGVFNNATIDTGDMLMVGDLSPTAVMDSDDTLKITAQNQLKAAS
jgi:hypothetical protein